MGIKMKLTSDKIKDQVWDNQDTKITKIFEAKIIEDKGDIFSIEFIDSEDRVVEADILKSAFEGHPVPPKQELWFCLVTYETEDHMGVASSAWSNPRFWKPCFKEYKN